MVRGSSDAAGLGTELVVLRVWWERQVLSPSEKESNEVELRRQRSWPSPSKELHTLPAALGGLTTPGNTERLFWL